MQALAPLSTLACNLNGASLRRRSFARQCQYQFISLLAVDRLPACGLPHQTNDARNAAVRVLNSYSRSVIKCVYGSIPRAVLIRRAFPYTQSQTALVGRGGAYVNLPVKLAILVTSSCGSIGLGRCS